MHHYTRTLLTICILPCLCVHVSFSLPPPFRTHVCQSPADGEGSVQSTWRGSQREQLSLCQRKDCCHQEHWCNSIVNIILPPTSIVFPLLLTCNVIHLLQNPSIADIYTEHAQQVTVACYAPSGFYIASGGKLPPSRTSPSPMLTNPIIRSLLSNSGTCVICADVSGKIRIWDTTQKEHLLKYEYQPFSGKIRDIAWTEDSKRMAVVGEGREKWVSQVIWVLLRHGRETKWVVIAFFHDDQQMCSMDNLNNS